MPFFGTPQRPNVRPLRNSHPQHPQHKKNKTKKYLGTHTRRPCGGYWVAPRLLRIGRNERNTTGTQQNTGYRHLFVILSSFMPPNTTRFYSLKTPIKTAKRHTIPPVFNCCHALKLPHVGRTLSPLAVRLLAVGFPLLYRCLNVQATPLYCGFDRSPFSGCCFVVLSSFS